MIAYPFGLEFLAGMFGCMMAGVVPCSVYPPRPDKLKIDLPAFMLKAVDAGAEYALSTNAFRRVMTISNIIGRDTKVSVVLIGCSIADASDSPSFSDFVACY